MLLVTTSPSRLPQWSKNRLHSFIASKEPGAAGHKVLPITVRQDARRFLQHQLAIASLLSDPTTLRRASI